MVHIKMEEVRTFLSNFGHLSAISVTQTTLETASPLTIPFLMQFGTRMTQNERRSRHFSLITYFFTYYIMLQKCLLLFLKLIVWFYISDASFNLQHKSTRITISTISYFNIYIEIINFWFVCKCSV